jgi:hypothetical protein
MIERRRRALAARVTAVNSMGTFAEVDKRLRLV